MLNHRPVCFLDFRNAFDLVDNSILVDKLSLYKCQGPDLNLISSYLQSLSLGVEAVDRNKLYLRFNLCHKFRLFSRLKAILIT